jgi:hypothetical protein
MASELPASRSATIFRSALLVVMILLCATSLYLCHRAIRVVERAVAVMEKVDTKMDRAIAAAPVAAERARELMNSTEAQQLRESAKAKAAEAAQRATDWLNRKVGGSNANP